MNPVTTLRRTAAAALLALASTSQAAIVEGADVGGFRTFVDTSTGTVWADLDNHLELTGTGFQFRFADRAAYLGALQAAGFVWATTGQVIQGFTATVPLTSTAEFVALGEVMSSLSFGESNTLDGYSNATDGLMVRNYGMPSWSAGTASWAMGGITPQLAPLNDSGMWAYLAGPVGGGGGSVPLPGTLALAGLGLIGLAGVSRRRAVA
jgi:PEP-CTERM motif